MLQPGLMMDRPLLVSAVIEHAAAQFGDVEIVSRETHGALHRTTYADCARRARQLARVLIALDLQPGDAVATIAWSNHRHLEAYYAISGSGMVIHTCNPRLHPDQLVYIINHAEDRVVFFDASFAALVERIAAQCPRVRTWVCMSEPAHMPPSVGVPDLKCYEDLMAAHSDTFEWPQFDERTGAALCYTSGTTGNPKGVLYSHRALVLNALSICLPSVSSISPHDTLMPVVPMFHVNAWCIPYATPIVGARLVLPGPKLDGASLYELIETAGVTVSAAVPTIWQALALHVEQHDLRFTTLRRAWIGGAAMPASLIKKFEEHYGVGVCHGWGMTETASTSTMGSLLPRHVTLPGPERHAVLAQQGFSLFGVELKVVDAHGATLPRDGVSQGELYIRGQWVLSRYFKSDASALVDGWFPTGDIATLDAHGVMQIRDRAKDVIKTGGEWISSIDLENTALSHPAVALAAVIGVRHPKWDERPLLFVVRKAGAALTRDEILAYLGERVVKWWVPDDVVFVESLPVGGTGKVQKGELRKQYDGVFS